MAGPGVSAVGDPLAEAHDRRFVMRLYYIERVAQAQGYAVWTGRRPRHIPPSVTDQRLREYRRQSHQYGGKPNDAWHFAALKRMLDREGD